MDRRWLVFLLAAALLSGCGATAAGPAAEGPETPPERLVQAIFYDADGTVINTVSYFYDEAGRVIQITTQFPERPEQTQENTYDQQGRLVESLYTWADNAPAEWETYVYDDQGFMTHYQLESDGSPRLEETYHYDAQGRKTAMERIKRFSGGPDTIESATIYFYEEDRLLREETETDSITFPVESVEKECAQVETRISSTQYTYDEDGRLVKERFDDGVTDPAYKLYFYEQDGAVSRIEEGEYVTRFTYGEDGLLLEEWNYDNCGENELYHKAYKYTSQQGGTTLNE